MIKPDDRGQWILLSAVVIAITMGALILLLNTAILTGHSSMNSVMSVPKDRIRDMRYQSITEVQIIGNNANAYSTPGSAVTDFNNNYSLFVTDMNKTYLKHGAIVNVTYTPSENASSRKIDNVSLVLLYNDGDTIYNENTTVGLNTNESFGG